MSRLTRRQKIIMGVAGLLIILRLFFPVQQCNRGRGSFCFEYRANPSATMLQVLGIAVIAAALLAIVPPGKRKAGVREKPPPEAPSEISPLETPPMEHHQPNVTMIAEARRAIDKMKFPNSKSTTGPSSRESIGYGAFPDPAEVERENIAHEAYLAPRRKRAKIRGAIIGVIVGLIVSLRFILWPSPTATVETWEGSVLLGLFMGFITFFVAAGIY
jgi:hypothetical protein